MRRRALSVAAALGLAVAAAGSASGQAIGRAALDSLTFPPLHFTPPVPVTHRIDGLKVLFLEDHTLPLVDVLARFKGGYVRFGRGSYAAGTALPEMLRFGGTRTLTPDSVNAELASWAMQTSFGGDGESITSSMNVLSNDLDSALDLWGAMLREPRFDSAQVEIWRGNELEEVRRQADDPGQLAFTAFNRLLYGNHPIGWRMHPSDLSPERFSRAALERLDRRIVCPGNLVLGVSGDVTWKRVKPLLRHMLKGWPPCSASLPHPRVPRIRRQAGIVVVPRDVDQSVIVMAHPTAVRMGRDPRYFAAKVGNQILGGGGLQSRLMRRVRVDSGFAYSASSVWTTPRRFDGIIGAMTRTRSDQTVPAIRLILKVMENLATSPPTPEEVRTVVEQLVNGFAFNFQDAAEVVSRRMYYESVGLPADWLERYLQGVRSVTVARVGRVLARNLRPRDMTILVVGDTLKIGMGALRALGPVTIWRPEREPPPDHIGPERGSARVGPQPAAVPQWSAAIPPVRSFHPTSPKPTDRKIPANLSGPGNSRTDAGR